MQSMQANPHRNFTSWKKTARAARKSPTPSAKTSMQAVLKKLLDCGKMIANVRGVGYRVVDPDDYTLQSAKCVVSGAKKINKGTKILSNAPVCDMSDEGRRKYNAVADRVKILQAAVSGARVEINMLSSKRENPLKLMAKDGEKAEREFVGNFR